MIRIFDASLGGTCGTAGLSGRGGWAAACTAGRAGRAAWHAACLAAAGAGVFLAAVGAWHDAATGAEPDAPRPARGEGARPAPARTDAARDESGGAGGPRPAAARPPAPRPARGEADGGAYPALGWLVRAEAGGVAIGRTRDVVEHVRGLPGIYTGAADPVVAVRFGTADSRPQDGPRSAVHREAVYDAPGGRTRIVFGRLSPAVLVESAEKSLRFAPAKAAAAPAGRPGDRRDFAPSAPEDARLPRYVAFVAAAADGRPSGPRVLAVAELGEAGVRLEMAEPWLVAWFGQDAPARGHAEVADQQSPAGSNKALLSGGGADRLDVPVLVRLERRPAALALRGGELVLEFAGPAGKVALMPLFGRRIWLAEETEAWKSGLPEEVLRQARLWARALRDFPVSVEESASADPERGEVVFAEKFAWTSMEDDWRTPPVKAAPVPPMLAVALGGGMPVTFHSGGRQVKPADGRWMDQAGGAMFIEGADAYEWRLAGLGKYVLPPAAPARPAAVPADARPLVERLERHVREMVQAGLLRPLLYIHGGLGTDWYANWYWAGGPETVGAIARAQPYLSADLQAAVREYAATELAARPPLTYDRSLYATGAERAPYAIPYDQVRAGTSAAREEAYRRRNFLLDLYRLEAARAALGVGPDPAALREQAGRLAADLEARMDWAILGPSRLRTVSNVHEARFMTLQGSAAYNSWLAGAVGLARLARRNGWAKEEQQAWRLAARLAAARVGQARYVAEMHRMGLVRGRAEDDPRCIAHIDPACTVVRWGPVGTVTMQDQEFPPFIDLVPEVGRLLGDFARPECAMYLAHLDEAFPYWYLSEGPKQTATEHRTCPLWHISGNVAAQAYVLGGKGEAVRRYVDATRFKGDLFYIQNLVAAIESYAE